jgi:hypothetical protein
MNKPLCVIEAPVFNRSGYGDLSTDLAKSLIRYGKFDVKIAATRWGNCPSKMSVDELETDEDRNLFSHLLIGQLNKQPDLYIKISIPNEFQPHGKYNIGITAGIETTTPSGEFVEGMNRMNLNIVTSNFVKDVFSKVNYKKQFEDGRSIPLVVEKPMEVCFWGANTKVYKKTDIITESIKEEVDKIPETFAYLFVGQWTHTNGLYSDRKDIGNLIKVFCSAFKDRKGSRPCLLLKTSGVNFSKIDKDDVLKKIKTIRDEVGGDLPNVYVLHGELSDEEMNSLFNHPKVKAHLSFTHGEGYGHPLLLASLSGKPMFVSRWSGHLDFLNPKYCNFFEGSVKPIHPDSTNQWLIKEGSWFYVVYGLAEEKIKNFYYSPQKSYFENAKKLAEENSQKFSIEQMDKAFHALLDKYVPTFSVEKQLVLPKLKKLNLPSLPSLKKIEDMRPNK